MFARLVPLLLPLAHIGLTGSIFLTLAVSLERYTTVRDFYLFSYQFYERCCSRWSTRFTR